MDQDWYSILSIMSENKMFWVVNIYYPYLTAIGLHPVAAVQYTFTHKQYTQYSSTVHIFTQAVHTIQQYSTHFHTNSTHNTAVQYTFTHKQYTQYSYSSTVHIYTQAVHTIQQFLVEAESTPGLYCGRKDNVNEKFQ
jgi:hypothetical protein